jgi:hypothetical protein
MNQDYPKMKTSVDMNRQMGNFIVRQRTKDGYFDAGYLLRQWNKVNQEKKISRFLEMEKTQSFIQEIIDQESHSAKMHDGIFQVVITIKGKNTYQGKKPDKVYMHPYLYMDFAMWLNSKFKYHVLKFVFDQLIEYRHAAGLGNNELMDAISRTWNVVFPPTYQEINIALNYIVFNNCYTGIRNSATIEQLRDLRDMQKIFAFNVLTGLIKNIHDLKLQLQKEYVRRHMPDHKTLKK